MTNASQLKLTSLKIAQSFLALGAIVLLNTGCLPSEVALPKSTADLAASDFTGVTKVTTIAATKVKISWNTSTDSKVVAYNIYDSSLKFAPVLLKTVGIGATEATLTGLTTAKLYQFRVRSANALGKEDTNLIDMGGIPYAGVQPAVVQTSSTALIPFPDASQANSVNIYCKSGAADFALVKTVTDVSLTSTQLTSLASGTTYTCRAALVIDDVIDNNSTTTTFTPMGQATHMAFTVQPASAAAGVNFPTQPVVTIYDANQNIVSAGPDANQNVTLTISTLSPSGGTVRGTASVAAVNGVATFTGLNMREAGVKILTATKADTSAVTNGSGPMPLDSNQFTISAGAVSAANSLIAISPSVPANPALIANGSAAYTVTITLADQYANPIAGIKPTFASNISGDTISQPAQNSNASGQSSGSITSTIADTNPARTLSIASPSGLTAVTTLAPFVPGAATKVIYVQQPVNSPAGNLGINELKVAISDAQGNVVTTGSASTSTISLTIASNVNGAILSGTVSAAAVAGVATFSDLGIDKTATGYRLAAISGSYTPAYSNTFNITAGTPRKIILAGPPSVVSGSCSTAYTIQLQDQGSNPSNAIANTPVNISGLGTAGLYTSSSCGGAALGSTITFTAGTSTKTVYLKDLKGEAITIAATDTSSVLTTGTLPVKITPDKIALLAMMPSPPAAPTTAMTVGSGRCSAAITVTPAGENGNPAPIFTPTPVSITGLVGSQAVIYSDAACTQVLNPSSVTLPVTIGTNYTTNIYLTDPKAEVVNITVLDAFGIMTTTTALQPVTVTASTLGFTGPASVVSGRCSTAFTLTLKDAAGNAVTAPSNTTLAIGGLASSTNGLFYTSATCAGGGSNSSVTIPANASSTMIYFSDLQAEDLYISVNDPAGNLSTSPTVNIKVSPSDLAISTPGSSSATTACAGSFTISTLDGSGSVTAAVTPITVNLTGAGTGGTFYTDSTCSTSVTQFVFSAGQNAKTFYFKGQTPQASLTFTASDAASVLNSGTATFAVTAAPGWLGTNATYKDSNGDPFWFRTGIVPVGARTDGPSSVGSIAFDPLKQNMYVLDTSARRVLKYDYVTHRYIGWLGGFNGAGGIGIEGSNLTTPSNAACVATVWGAVTPGWCVGGQPTSSGNNANGVMNYPFAIAADGNYVYVGDSSGFSILRYDANTGAFAGWLGRVFSTPTSAGPGGPAACTSLAVGAQTPGWCKGGQNHYNVTMANPYTGNGFIAYPRVMTYNAGYLYVGTQGAILRFDVNDGSFQGWVGVVAATPPTGGTGCTTKSNGQLTPGWCFGGTFQTSNPRTGVAGGGGVNTPSGMIVIGTTLYVLHGDNAGTITTYDAGTGQYLGLLPSLSYNWVGTGNLTTDGTNLFVADSNRIARVDTTGLVTGWVGKVSNNASMSGSAGCSTLVPNANTPGWCLGGSSKAGVDEQAVNQALAIAYDGNGNLITGQWVSFPAIKMWSAATGIYSGTLGHSSTSPSEWSNDATSFAQYQGYDDNSMYTPEGAYNDGTYLYVVEQAAQRVKKINAATGKLVGWIGGITTSPTGGAAGCVGANAMGPSPGWCTGSLPSPQYLWNQMIGQTTNGLMYQPFAITGDGTYIYIADMGWHRIEKFNASTGVYVGWIGGVGTTSPTGGAAGCIGAAAGTFTSGWCTGGTPQLGTGDGLLNQPNAILYNSGNIYVMDSSNHRVVSYSAATGAFNGWIGRTNAAPTSGCTVASNGGYNVSTSGWCKGGTSQAAGQWTDRGGGFYMWAAGHNGLATDGTYLYITNFYNMRIDKYTFGGVYQGSTLPRYDVYTATWTTNTATLATWNVNCSRPTGLWADTTNMYVAVDNSCGYGASGVVKIALSTGTVAGWRGAIAPGNSPTAGQAGCPGATTTTPGWCMGGGMQAGYRLGQFTGGSYGITGDANFVYVFDENAHRMQRLPK